MAGRRGPAAQRGDNKAAPSFSGGVAAGAHLEMTSGGLLHLGPLPSGTQRRGREPRVTAPQKEWASARGGRDPFLPPRLPPTQWSWKQLAWAMRPPAVPPGQCSSLHGPHVPSARLRLALHR